MPITTHIDESKDLTIFTVKGLLTFDEVMPVVKAFYDGETTKHVMWNLLETEDIELTPGEIEKVANFSPRFEGRRESGKTAFIAQEDLHFGLSKMFIMENSISDAPHATMVFRDEDEAYQWFDEP